MYEFRAFSPAEGNGRIVPRDNGDNVVLGFDPGDGIMVPRPGRVQPKPGHWRVTPGGRLVVGSTLKRHENWQDNPLHSGRVDGDYQRERMRASEARSMSVRERVAAAVACGQISAADSPF